MKWIWKHRYLTGGTFIILAACLFRIFPHLSGLWTDTVIRPFNLIMHKLTGNTAFPVLEIICILVAGILFTGLVCAMYKAIARKTIIPMVKWIKIPVRVLLTVSCVYIFLWYPAYWTGAEIDPVIPDIDQVKWLCTEMIQDLNTADFGFSSPENILKAAADVSGIPGARIKYARYPEWMHYLHIAGLYAPWTGEAIVNIAAYPATLPFTAVHELMHLNGIADEGSANIAAWELCKSAGGEFFTSAKLWVLKYAMEMVADAESEAAPALYAQMSDTLFDVFSHMNGRARTDGRSTGALLAALGLSRSTSSYPDVVGYVLSTSPR